MSDGRLAFLLAASAAAALWCSAADAHGTMGGTAGAGSATHGTIHRHPVPVGFARFSIASPFRASGIRRFPETTLTVAGYDDDYDTGGYDESDLADMHFRAQDSFGPWDVPIRPIVAEPATSRSWGAPRMDPWHGYGPQDDW